MRRIMLAALLVTLFSSLIAAQPGSIKACNFDGMSITFGGFATSSGGVYFNITNNSPQPVTLTGFDLVWPDEDHPEITSETAPYELGRVRLGIANDDMNSAPVIWEGPVAEGNTSLTPPYNNRTDSALVGTWVTDTTLPVGSNWQFWLDFDPLTGSLFDYGARPWHFDNPLFRFSCDQVNTETPTTDPNVTPTETATLDPNITPTESPTLDVTETATSEITETPTVEITPSETATETPGTPTETETPTASATFPTDTPTASLTHTPTRTPDPGVEMVTNGGFEDGNKVPTGWKEKNLTKDKRKCNKPGKVIAFEGECALQFKGGDAEKSSFKQDIALEAFPIAAGDIITLSAQVNASGDDISAKVKLTVVFTDTVLDKLKLSLDITPTTGYTLLSEARMLVTDNIGKIKVQVSNRSGKGKVFVDAVSLLKQAHPALALP
jgi:hypothetical protein